eukprot:TRINITY_DN27179_c0_g1_i1.p1 TRINITY_DN27179_c0_g1~~TRINITY_DN27179_c0_g1_i1.p1  ORF type:complete len:360 (+),score=78.41 TRINITY_DN27179_c0_g1_i1:58-1137(+)
MIVGHRPLRSRRADGWKFALMAFGSVVCVVTVGQHRIQTAKARRGAVALDASGLEDPEPPNGVPQRPIEQTEWRGLVYETDGEWDFYGLKVPKSSAVSRARPGQVKADYDFTAVDGRAVPAGYEDPRGMPPAFAYPPSNDRLFVTVSTRPRVLFFPDLLTDAEVDEALRQARGKMVRSQVALTKDQEKEGKASEVSEVRTSMSTWIDLTGALSNLDKRLSHIVGSTWHEPLNVLNYGVSQHYNAHQDYFDPARYGPQTNNRMATFYLYLSDTEAGGATTIPRANGGAPPPNFKAGSCQQGLQVFPRKGSAVLFYDMRPDRSLDPFALHGACDVEAGSKWGGPVWFRAATPDGTGHSRDI